jgi:hypothetical protein
MSHLYRDVLHMMERLSVQQWMLVLVVAIVVGVFCLRGFGSRSEY